MKYFIPLLAVMCFAVGGCKSTCCGKCGGDGDAAAKACPADCTKACCAKK